MDVNAGKMEHHLSIANGNCVKSGIVYFDSAICHCLRQLPHRSPCVSTPENRTIGVAYETESQFPRSGLHRPYPRVTSSLPTICRLQVEHKQLIGNGHLIGSSLGETANFFTLICNWTGDRIF